MQMRLPIPGFFYSLQTVVRLTCKIQDSTKPSQRMFKLVYGKKHYYLSPPCCEEFYILLHFYFRIVLFALVIIHLADAPLASRSSVFEVRVKRRKIA